MDHAFASDPECLRGMPPKRWARASGPTFWDDFSRAQGYKAHQFET